MRQAIFTGIPTGVLLVILLVAVFTAPCLAAKRYLVWQSPDSLFKVGGFTRLATERLPMVMPDRPPGMEGLRLIEVIIGEPGEWLQFGISLRRIPKVVFAKGAKIILIDKLGRRVESEGLFFCSDKEQTEVYDTRTRDVVVTLRSIWSRTTDSTATGTAKFPRGSIEVKNIVSFEVVGGIAVPIKSAIERR